MIQVREINIKKSKLKLFFIFILAIVFTIIFVIFTFFIQVNIYDSGSISGSTNLWNVMEGISIWTTSDSVIATLHASDFNTVFMVSKISSILATIFISISLILFLFKNQINIKITEV